MWTKTELEKGWILSNNENGESVIQKLDDSNRFKSDEEAVEFVVKSYNDLVEACKSAYRALSLDSDMEEDFAPEIKQLTKAIDIAEGRI